jgi:GH24 family phage-related lysozyme (muramidase)
MIRAVTIMLLVGACAKPPPPSVPPAPEPKIEPAPPPPKCEKLAEGCAATADTRVEVGATWSMTPPATWTYAKESDATVARIDGAALAVTVYDARGDKKAATKQRDDALASLTAKIGVKLPKKMTWPAKPARTMNVGDRELGLYQIEGSTQEGKPGALLVFVTRAPAEDALLGIGFVTESDAKDSDRAILAGVESLRPQKSGAAK